MKHITKEQLSILSDLSPLSPFLFNRDEIVYFDKELPDIIERLIELNLWSQYYEEFLKKNNSDIEINISKNQNEQRWVVLKGQVVIFEGRELILGYCREVSKRKRKEFELDREKKLRSLMLELTQSIFIANSISEIFDLSLVNAIKALEKSSYGSIMLKQGNMFQTVSYYGFSADILNFKLPCENTFLARNTDNKMDRFVRINQDKLGDQVSFNLKQENRFIIGSTLSGPIIVEGQLYAIFNIDSLENNAFNDNDVQMMEFIRNTVEVAITNHKLYQQKLFLSRYDNLTQLYNRHYFEDQFEQNRKRAVRYEEKFAIVLFDIDYFKSINDRYGHFIGDQVLKHVSDLLKSNQRDSDVLARFGGDEFIGILFNSNVEELNRKYFELNEMLTEKDLKVDDLNIACSFSFGIAQYPNDGETLDDLVKVADFEMYRNKRTRREKLL